MKSFALKFKKRDVVVQTEPEVETRTIYETVMEGEARDVAAGCAYIGLAVRMPYGFQLYTEAQWESLSRRIGTFPSMMRRHMRPLFVTLTRLDPQDEELGFPDRIAITEALARYGELEDWPEDGEGAMEALMIQWDDGRIYILRADKEEEFMEAMNEQ